MKTFLTSILTTTVLAGSLLAQPAFAQNNNNNGIPGQLAEIRDNLQQLEDIIDGLQGNSSDLEDRVEALESDVASLETKVSSLDTMLEDTKTRVDTVESGLATVENEVSQLGATVDDALDRLASAENDLITVDGRLNMQEGDIINLQNMITDIVGDIVSITSDISDLGMDIGKILVCSEQQAFYAPNDPQADIYGCVAPMVEPVLPRFPNDVLIPEIRVDTANGFPNSVTIDLADLPDGAVATHLDIDTSCTSLGSDAASRTQLFQFDADGNEVSAHLDANGNSVGLQGYDLCLISGVLNNESTGTRVSHFLPIVEGVETIRIDASLFRTPGTASNNANARAFVTVRGRAAQ